MKDIFFKSLVIPDLQGGTNGVRNKSVIISFPKTVLFYMLPTYL